MNKDAIKKLMLEGTSADKKAFLAFDDHTDIQIYYKFQVFARTFFPLFFTSKSAPFHREFVLDYIRSYVHNENVSEIAFRGAGKTGLLKLFVTFVLLNDTKKRKKFIKILAKDLKNPKDFVTDVYNGIVDLIPVYGDPFMKDDGKKRDQTMTSFSFKDDRRLLASTVGQTQRGHTKSLAGNRPDWIIWDDVEDRESVSSAVITNSIINAIDEAITGLPVDGTGSWVLAGNYISDTGVVEYLKNIAKIDRVTPIMDASGEPMWEAITKEMIEKHRRTTRDFWGEYCCQPARMVDKFFNIERIERDMAKCRVPDTISGSVKYWGKYQPHHAYGLGSDHSEGIGQDSNTMCLFDFNTGEVVATQAGNTIAPDLHAHECVRVAREFGNAVWAPETNNRCGGIVMATARQKEYNNFYRQPIENKVVAQMTQVIGWNTTHKTKTNAFMEFRTAYEDGKISIYDVDLLKEMKAYTNSDITDTTTGLVTRHFDLLTAAVIAWQTKKQAITMHTIVEDDDFWEDIKSAEM